MVPKVELALPLPAATNTIGGKPFQVTARTAPDFAQKLKLQIDQGVPFTDAQIEKLLALPTWQNTGAIRPAASALRQVLGPFAADGLAARVKLHSALNLQSSRHPDAPDALQSVFWANLKLAQQAEQYAQAVPVQFDASDSDKNQALWALIQAGTYALERGLGDVHEATQRAEDGNTAMSTMTEYTVDTMGELPQQTAEILVRYILLPDQERSLLLASHLTVVEKIIDAVWFTIPGEPGRYRFDDLANGAVSKDKLPALYSQLAALRQRSSTNAAEIYEFNIYAECYETARTLESSMSPPWVEKSRVKSEGEYIKAADLYIEAANGLQALAATASSEEARDLAVALANDANTSAKKLKHLAQTSINSRQA